MLRKGLSLSAARKALLKLKFVKHKGPDSNYDTKFEIYKNGTSLFILKKTHGNKYLTYLDYRALIFQLDMQGFRIKKLFNTIRYQENS